MATFNYTVDTKPMAEEIKSVSRHVNATTGAVVAMQAAVINAEERAAEHVCDNVNKGFYSLIRSQISQKIAKLQSDADSHFMQLTQQKKALLGIRERMGKDYHMISARYTKLFNGLNTNLKQRIFELDKPTIDFALKEIDRFANRTKHLTATIPLAQTESISISQQIIASNVKKRGLNLINSMKDYLQDANSQKKVNEEILLKNKNISESAEIYLPIIISENFGNNTNSIYITIPDEVLGQAQKMLIRNTVFSNLDNITWKEPSKNPEISEIFTKMVSSSENSEREKEMMLKLYHSSNFKTS